MTKLGPALDFDPFEQVPSSSVRLGEPLPYDPFNVPVPEGRPEELGPSAEAPRPSSFLGIDLNEPVAPQIPGALEAQLAMTDIALPKGRQTREQINQIQQRIAQLKAEGGNEDKIANLERALIGFGVFRAPENLKENLAKSAALEYQISEQPKSEFSEYAQQAREGKLSELPGTIYEGVTQDPTGASKAGAGLIIGSSPMIAADVLGGIPGLAGYGASEASGRAFREEVINRSPDPEKLRQDMANGKTDEFFKIYDENKDDIDASLNKKGLLGGVVGAAFGMIPGASSALGRAFNVLFSYPAISTTHAYLENEITQVPVLDENGKPKMDESGKVVLQDAESLSPSELAMSYGQGVLMGLPFEAMHTAAKKISARKGQQPSAPPPGAGPEAPAGGPEAPAGGPKAGGPEGIDISQTRGYREATRDDAILMEVADLDIQNALERKDITEDQVAGLRQQAIDRIAGMSREERTQRAEMARQVGAGRIGERPLDLADFEYIQSKREPRAPEEEQPAAGAEQPKAGEKVAVEDVEILKGAGYTVEDILTMNTRERAAQVREAKANQVTPEKLTDEEKAMLTPQAKPKEAPKAEQKPETQERPTRLGEPIELPPPSAEAPATEAPVVPPSPAPTVEARGPEAVVPSPSAPPAAPKKPKTFGELFKESPDVTGVIGDLGFSLEGSGGHNYLRVRSMSGKNKMFTSMYSDEKVPSADIWDVEDPRTVERRRGNINGIGALEANIQHPGLARIFRDWLEGRIDPQEAIARIKAEPIEAQQEAPAPAKPSGPAPSAPSVAMEKVRQGEDPLAAMQQAAQQRQAAQQEAIPMPPPAQAPVEIAPSPIELIARAGPIRASEIFAPPPAEAAAPAAPAPKAKPITLADFIPVLPKDAEGNTDYSYLTSKIEEVTGSKKPLKALTEEEAAQVLEAVQAGAPEKVPALAPAPTKPAPVKKPAVSAPAAEAPAEPAQFEMVKGHTYGSMPPKRFVTMVDSTPNFANSVQGKAPAQAGNGRVKVQIDPTLIPQGGKIEDAVAKFPAAVKHVIVGKDAYKGLSQKDVKKFNAALKKIEDAGGKITLEGEPPVFEKKKRSRPTSELGSFIAANGGIKGLDSNGKPDKELKNMRDRKLPGLVRANGGKDLWEALQAAVQEGYYPEWRGSIEQTRDYSDDDQKQKLKIFVEDLEKGGVYKDGERATGKKLEQFKKEEEDRFAKIEGDLRADLRSFGIEEHPDAFAIAVQIMERGEAADNLQAYELGAIEAALEDPSVLEPVVHDITGEEYWYGVEEQRIMADREAIPAEPETMEADFAYEAEPSPAQEAGAIRGEGGKREAKPAAKAKPEKPSKGVQEPVSGKAESELTLKEAQKILDEYLAPGSTVDKPLGGEYAGPTIKFNNVSAAKVEILPTQNREDFISWAKALKKLEDEFRPLSAEEAQKMIDASLRPGYKVKLSAKTSRFPEGHTLLISSPTERGRAAEPFPIANNKKDLQDWIKGVERIVPEEKAKPTANGEPIGDTGLFIEKQTLKSMSPKDQRKKIDYVLSKYFEPGTDVPSYGGEIDRVVSFNPNGENWSVTVQEVTSKGLGPERTHSTAPSKKNLEQKLGKDYNQDWVVTGDLAKNKDVLDKLGFTPTRTSDGIQHRIFIGDDPTQAILDAKKPKAPVEEKGAEGKPQMVIPGAEKISGKELAQRKAEAPLKAQVPQKDAGGLFSDEANQKDLMDIIRDQKKQEVEKPKPPEWMVKHANDYNADVVYFKNNIGLAFAVSDYGVPLYLPMKKEGDTIYYSEKDLSKYTNNKNHFKQEELDELNKARLDLIAQDEISSATNPNGPFENADRVKSEHIPENLFNLMNDWLDMLGIENRVIITTPEDVSLANYSGRYRRMIEARTARPGKMFPFGNGDYAISIKLNPRMSYNIENLAHEIGHILFDVSYKNADAATKSEIDKDYQEWKKKALKGTQGELVKSLRPRVTAKLTKGDMSRPAEYLTSYWTSFDEYFADHVARYMVSEEKPQSVVGKFFKRIADALKRLYSSVAGLTGKSSKSMKAYLDDLISTIEKNKKERGKGGENMRARESRGTFDEEDIHNMNRQNGYNAPKKKPTNAPVETNVDIIKRLFQDEFNYVKKAQDYIEGKRSGPLPDAADAYANAALMPGRTSERIAKLEREEVLPIYSRIKELDIPVLDLHWYMYAKYAPKRNADMAARDPKKFGPGLTPGSGMHDDTAAQILKKFDNRKADFEELAGMVYKMLENDLDRRLEEGLLTQEQYDELKKDKNYVPLTGFAEEYALEDNKMNYDIGGGIGVSRKESKVAFGRASLADNTLINAILKVEEGIYRIERNRAAKSLLALARLHPDPELWTVNKMKLHKEVGPDGRTTWVTDGMVGANTVIAKIGGIPHYIDLKNPGLARAFKSMGIIRANKLLRAVGTLTRVFSQIKTSKNPAFVIQNTARDVEGVIAAAKVDDPELAKQIRKQYARAGAIALQGGKLNKKDQAIYDAWKAKPEQQRNAEFDNLPEKVQNAFYYDDWSEAGGKISYNLFKDMKDRRDELVRLTKGVDPIHWNNLPRSVANRANQILRSMWNGLDEVGRPFEEVTRIAVYTAARSMKDQNGNHVYSRIQAARKSQDYSTNFFRRGEWTPVTNALWAFSNAAVQGDVFLGQKLFGTKRGLILTAKIMGLFTALAMSNMLLSDDDENEEGRKNYMNIPERERATGLIIKYGKGPKDYVRFPLLPMFASMWDLTNEAVMVAFGQRKPFDAGVKWLGNTWEAHNPLGDSSVFGMLFPTILKPFYDIHENKNYFGVPIHPEEKDWNIGKPAYTQTTGSVSPITTKLSEFAYNYSNGIIDIYPNDVEYIANYFVNGLGSTLQGIFGTARDIATGKEIEAAKVPVLKYFVPSKWDESGRYYDLRDQVYSIKNKAEEETGKKYKLTFIRRTDKRLKKLREALRENQNNPDLNARQKQINEKEIRDQMKATYNRGMKKMLTFITKRTEPEDETSEDFEE